MPWAKSDPKKLRDLKADLEKLRALVRAQKIKEMQKLEKVIDGFDAKTQDALREVTDAGKMG